MKKVVFYVVIFMFVCVTNAHAVKNPNRVTLWNKFTDAIATMGKSDAKKEAIRNTRKKNRREARIFKNKQASKKKIQKSMREQNNAIMSTIKSKKVPHSRGGVDAR